MTRRWAVALTLLWVVAMAGCGQPPPSSAEATEETTAESTEGTIEETTAETTTVEVGGSPELDVAADEYEEYVVEQTALLADLTEGFTDAVVEGTWSGRRSSTRRRGSRGSA